MPQRILVVNPGTHPELLHQAVGLQETHGEVTYLTSAMIDGQRWPWSRLAESGVGPILAPRLTPPSLAGRVGSYAVPGEVAFQLARRFLPRAAEPTLRLRNRWFISRATSTIRKDINDLQLLIAQHPHALEPFANAGSETIRVLNCPLPHFRWLAEYLGIEAASNPRWQPLLQNHDVSSGEHQVFLREIEEADYLLTASSFAARTYLDEGVPAKKILVNPLGVDARRFNAPPMIAPHPREPLRVLFAGQINQRKGLSYLIEAIEALGPRHVDLRLVGPVSSAAAALVRHHAPNARLLGPVGQQDLLRHFSWAHAVVLPSLAEGFGLTALEAMAAGRVSIVSEHTFAADIITHGENGFIVPPRDPRAIAEILEDLRAGLGKAREVGAAALATADEFSWERYARKISADLLGKLD